MRSLISDDLNALIAAVLAAQLKGTTPEKVALDKEWWTGPEDVVTARLVLDLRHSGKFRGHAPTLYLATNVAVLAVADMQGSAPQLLAAAFDSSAVLTAFGLPPHGRAITPDATLTPRTVKAGTQIPAVLDAYGLSPTSTFEFQMAGSGIPDDSIEKSVIVKDAFFADFVLAVGRRPGLRDLVMRDKIVVDGSQVEIEELFPACLLVTE